VNLSRFLSSDRSVFKLVFGGSNVLGLAPNLVSSFLPLSTLIRLHNLRFGLVKVQIWEQFSQVGLLQFQHRPLLGRQTVWVDKWCLIELIFGQYVGNSYVYLSTKFRADWICGLRAVCWLLKRTEAVISLSLLYLTSCGCCCCCRWATRRSVL
jgi:hypothetical protein